MGMKYERCRHMLHIFYQSQSVTACDRVSRMLLERSRVRWTDWHISFNHRCNESRAAQDELQGELQLCHTPGPGVHPSKSATLEDNIPPPARRESLPASLELLCGPHVAAPRLCSPKAPQPQGSAAPRVQRLGEMSPLCHLLPSENRDGCCLHTVSLFDRR